MPPDSCPVLEGIEAEVGDPRGHVGMPVNAEDAALFTGPVFTGPLASFSVFGFRFSVFFMAPHPRPRQIFG